jgi:peptidoglycan/LPS O-acetylase OafA/YrhL
MLNRHWTPRGATDFIVAGGVALLLAGTWWVMDIRRWALPWLVVLGQTAFMLYFVHQVIALSLVNQVLGLRFNNRLVYSAANVVLIAALVGLGMAWLVIKRAAHRAMPRPVPVP